VAETTRWSDDRRWPDVIYSAYANDPKLITLSRKGLISVGDWLRTITLRDPWIYTFNVKNSDNTINQDEVWKFINVIGEERLSLIQTKDDAKTLEPFTAYLVVGQEKGSGKGSDDAGQTDPRKPKPRDTDRRTHIELYNSTIRLLPKEKPFRPTTIEIAQDTDVLVRLGIGLPDLASIARGGHVAP
jgi:hypothetical protein